MAAQPLRVTLEGMPVAEVFPAEGIWAQGLAEQIVDAMEPEDVLKAAALSWPQPGEAHERQRRAEVVFGPASSGSDRERATELESGGALVRVARGRSGAPLGGGDRGGEGGERPLIALPLPGTSPRAAWLEDALAAFDGERVGLTFGGGLGPGAHPEPLYLHDLETADASLALLGRRPAYLVLRRELLGELRAADEMPAPVLAAIVAALGRGWVIGHRDSRGLDDPAYGPRELGEAFGRREARAAVEAPGEKSLGPLARAAGRGLLTLGWTLLKGRGRLSPHQRRLIAGMAHGSAVELRRGRATRRPPV